MSEESVADDAADADDESRPNGGATARDAGGTTAATDPPAAGRGRLASLLSGVRFGKFVSVGVVGAICDIAVLTILLDVVGVFPEVAVLIGIETAILVMFLVNDRWTFADERAGGRRSFFRRLGRSHVVRAAGSTTQFLVFVLVFRGVDATLLLAGGDRWWLVAKIAGVGVGMLVNYVFESLFTWQVHVDGES